MKKLITVTTLFAALFAASALSQTASQPMAGIPVTPVVTDVTALITNSAAWSAALLDKRADYYSGQFWAYDASAQEYITQGEFTMRPFGAGVFMITKFVVGGTNEVYIDPAKPMPGFPSVGKTCHFNVWVNGYAKMANGLDNNTRYGGFDSSNFQPGDAIDISINPNQVRMALAVNGLVGDPNNMTLQIAGGYGYYDSYLSSIIGQTVFTAYVDPIQSPIGSMVDWTITDRSNNSTWSGQTTVNRGMEIATVDAITSGIELSNDGGVKEVYLNDNTYRQLGGNTYNSTSPWANSPAPVKYLNVFVNDVTDVLNIEVGGYAMFKVYGFKDGVLTDVTPKSPNGGDQFVIEAYGLSGYTAYQVIVTSIAPTEKTFSISVWKYNNGGGGFSPTTGEPIQASPVTTSP